MSDYYEFECGCKIRQFGTNIKPEDGLPPLEIDFYNLRDCPRVWQDMKTGLTKGVFQLESQLGQSWCKKVEPSSIEQICALISLIRPGVLNSILPNGKSMAQSYVDRKNKTEEVSLLHKELGQALDSTYHIILYQEQAMSIAAILAGFDLNEADQLRKAIGKKDAELMSKVENMFLEGCKKVGKCTEEEAKQIFSYLKEAQRYSFNQSHGQSYGAIAYATQYVKTHFPLHFYTAWLICAEEKIDPQEEMSELILDAKLHNIDVYPPSLVNLANKNYDGNFSMNKTGIYFGINNVKKIGHQQTIKFINAVKEVENKLNKPIINWTWFEILVNLTPLTTKTVMNNLIAVGIFNHLKCQRREILFEYGVWDSLNEREQKYIIDNQSKFNSLLSALMALKDTPRKEGGPATVGRVDKINSLINTMLKPPVTLKDDALWISNNERELLGISITNTALDTCKTVISTHQCKDVLDGYKGKAVLGVEIKSSREHIIKKAGKNFGKTMAFLCITDNSSTLNNVVCFPDTWAKYSHQLYNGATVVLEGKADKDSFVVNRVISI